MVFFKKILNGCMANKNKILLAEKKTKVIEGIEKDIVDNMNSFSEKSKKRLDTCHPYLQLICYELLKIYDITILEGHRDEEKQNNYYHAGKSKLRFPNSKHNKTPSMAVDIAPWHKKEPHIRWDDMKSFYFMLGLVKGIASQLHIDIRIGADWDNDTDFTDNQFNDLVHIELTKK
jgi:peptidoglycan L-alanyl-D-glutamate endopeptidase CwlK